MSQNIADNFGNTFIRYMHEAVKQAVADEYDKAIEEATKRAIERRDEVVASVSLSLYRRMEVNTFGENLTITIDKSSLDEKRES